MIANWQRDGHDDLRNKRYGMMFISLLASVDGARREVLYYLSQKYCAPGL